MINKTIGNIRNTVSVARVFVAMLAILLSGAKLHSQHTIVRKISELKLRLLAKNIVVPKYPEDAIKERRTGVAVAALSIDERGVVVKVEPLEAPSPSIGKALSEAFYRWQFTPSSVHGQNIKMNGKLTYYFLFQNGRPVVLSPDEAPFVGPQYSNISQLPDTRNRFGTLPMLAVDEFFTGRLSRNEQFSYIIRSNRQAHWYPLARKYVAKIARPLPRNQRDFRTLISVRLVLNRRRSYAGW